jgi:hypothetical protein
MTDQDARELRRLVRLHGHAKVILELKRFLVAQRRREYAPITSALQRAYFFSVAPLKAAGKS